MSRILHSLWVLGILGVLGVSSAFSTQPSIREYDPLRISDKNGKSDAQPEFKDFEIKDEKRSREIPVRVYFPISPVGKDNTKDKDAAKAKSNLLSPVILFSHGLGGARSNNPYLGKHWSARGYFVVFVQHPGSDESVWKDKPPAERMTAMKKAANAQNFLLRVQDIPVVLDQLAKWNKSADHPLAERLDLQRLGMSGHSFGALTTQAVSGQTFPGGKVIGLTETRIKAAVAMSPSSPRGGDVKKAFGEVKIPWLLMTGTHDKAIIGDADVASRLAVFSALPKGAKYELVLDKAEHMAFSERDLANKTQRNPNHHRAILAITTAFWDAYLKENADARKWLESESVRGVLEKNDRWQKK